MPAKYLLGIDVGGTKIATGISDKKGRLIGKITLPTQAQKGKNRVIRNITQSVYDVLYNHKLTIKEIAAIGIGIAGEIDHKNGLLIKSPNLPGFKNTPLREIIEHKFSKKVFLENDANAAALGELIFGAAKKSHNFIYLTISTGIGGGIIINGKIYHGKRGITGEVGHTIILPKGPRCSCKRDGCLESISSGTAIGKAARKIAREDPKKAKLLIELAQGDIKKISALTVGKAAKIGDPLALKILQEAISYLAISISNLIMLLDPEKIVIGGGVAEIGPLFFKLLRKELKRLKTPIVPAKLKTDAGIFGAIALCL